ncbi:cadherin-like beta sandwich domain-containing protein [Cohnella rhizosphaerae]|uniref:Cadherin-like beta sandwich domain-containing protein n=1 Tax=Cohnella rhizosphaerae TaxID=1457232 RepID=A0A9X4KVN9_9BACL|nr:cadherin-like beta sandwich domain-containing protein [Cohnella rhizosphaerae]MDG0811772.1 cadherin-like beta sandwich domain-containing protein [Cohnella rhizosphaerae]
MPDAYQSSAYGYVYAFDPVPGSQVHTLEFRDGYGRIVDYEVNLYYGETTEDLNVGDEATVAYGAGSLLTLHPTAGALSATLPAGTPWVDLDLALGSHGEAALFDEEGQEIAASGGSGPIRLTLPDTDPDNNAILTYDVVVTDSDDTGSSGPARVLYTLYLYMAQDIQYAPADMAWNASASGTGLPAEEAEWMYDRQQRYALVVPEELDTLHVYVTPGYGVANVTLTGMAGPDGNGGYSGSLSVGSNSFVMTVNYVDGQRKVYELTAYRGAPVAPVLNVGDQPFAFHYDPASNGYEVYLADSPGTAALSLGLPPGAEVFEAVSEDAPLDRNADGSYVLNLAGASGAKVLSVSGLYNGVAWSCEIRVYFGSV